MSANQLTDGQRRLILAAQARRDRDERQAAQPETRDCDGTVITIPCVVVAFWPAVCVLVGLIVWLGR